MDISIGDVVHKEWLFWQKIYGSGKYKNKKNEWFMFKKYWDFFSLETEQIFKEMKKLSKDLLIEWRIKYTYSCIYIYEYKNTDANYKKTKSELWKEFKNFWCLDINNYHEIKLDNIKRDIKSLKTDENFELEMKQRYITSFKKKSILEEYIFLFDLIKQSKKLKKIINLVDIFIVKN